MEGDGGKVRLRSSACLGTSRKDQHSHRAFGARKVFAKIDLDIDVNARKARFFVPNFVEAGGEPIINPVTKTEHRARFNMPDGFEFTLAEVGRGWAKTNGAITLNLADSHAHFAELNITGTGVIR